MLLIKKHNVQFHFQDNLKTFFYLNVCFIDSRMIRLFFLTKLYLPTISNFLVFFNYCTIPSYYLFRNMMIDTLESLILYF